MVELKENMAEVTKQKASSPSWIDREFVQTSLNCGRKNGELNVETVAVDCASEEGMGYLSSIFRIVATVKDADSDKNDQVQLIAKCANGEGKLQEMAQDNEAFRTESLMLSEIIPAAHSLLMPVEGEAFRPLAARCYLYGKQPVEFLVMEDLVAAGFRNADPGYPLDYDHCALVLRNYARLHAASVRVLKEQPQYKARCDPRNLIHESQIQSFKLLADMVFKAVTAALRSSAGCERYAEKYAQLSDTIVAKVSDFWMSDDVILPVMLHGDCWKNNFMFKYVGDAVTEVRIIDFQFSKAHCPSTDLQCFLYANASEEVHRHHMDSLLAGYHSCLQHTLRALGMTAEAEAYTLQELRKDMDRAAIIGVYISAMRGIFITSEKNGAALKEVFSRMDDSSGALENAFKDPSCLSYLKYLAPIFEGKGLL